MSSPAAVETASLTEHTSMWGLYTKLVKRGIIAIIAVVVILGFITGVL
jgi:hypothetical protein